MNRKRIKTFLAIALLALCAVSAAAQSSSVDYPTPITSSEVKGVIRARDIGDSRLTTHYYVFDGSQGDIFINVETSNLNGDIDVFLAGSLKPLTKFSVYADTSLTQVGRTIYLRKSERLILKIEGRTPSDDPANYTIKFDGSFVAIADPDSIPKDPTAVPEIKPSDDGDVRVNSVGTIIEVKPKPAPEPKVTVARNTRRTTRRAAKPAKPKPAPEEIAKKEEAEPKEDQAGKPEVVITDNIAVAETEKKESAKKTPARKTRAANKRTAAKSKKPATETTEVVTEPKANPLESVKLLVVLKNGEWFSYPMSDVVKVGVDNKGMLTIITKKGEIKRYSILDVSKMTIE